MQICLRCKRCKIKPTFSFYCRRCYKHLLQKCSITFADYITYFEIMYNRIIPVQGCKFNNFRTLHHHYQHNLHLTDKPLAELLEVILFLKANKRLLIPLPLNDLLERSV